jgi:D-glycero-D-manno-heptose 1,7-bisphosphate phosphatase
VFIPFTIGGGIRSVEDAQAVLDAGADKVSVNSAAVQRPELIAELAEVFGAQCVVLAIAAKQTLRKGSDPFGRVEGLGSDPFRRVEGLRRGRGGPPDAVFLDRDGTLVEDVPYNGDPGQVRPLPGAREALDRLRAAGIGLAVVSNQSGIGRGMLSAEQVDAVNGRVEELLGPLGPWFLCPHEPAADCECRKPRPGLVLRAAERLGVDPRACAVIGDIGADVEAARAAGARGVLVPTRHTLRREIVAAPEVAWSLPEAVDRLLV